MAPVRASTSVTVSDDTAQTMPSWAARSSAESMRLVEPSVAPVRASTRQSSSSRYGPATTTPAVIATGPVGPNAFARPLMRPDAGSTRAKPSEFVIQRSSRATGDVSRLACDRELLDAYLHVGRGRAGTPVTTEQYDCDGEAQDDADAQRDKRFEPAGGGSEPSCSGLTWRLIAHLPRACLCRRIERDPSVPASTADDPCVVGEVMGVVVAVGGLLGHGAVDDRLQQRGGGTGSGGRERWRVEA